MEINPHLTGLMIIYSIFFLQNASPGVNTLAVMATSMSAGRQSGLALGFGVALGTLTWSTASVVGLSALIVGYSSVLWLIKVIGACYLFWLAYKSLKAAFASNHLNDHKISNEVLSPQQYLYRGYIVNITNPKAAIGWLAIVSLGLSEGFPWWVGVSIVLGTFLISLAVHVTYAVVFSTPRMINLYHRARRPIQGTLGLFFAYAGHRLITSKI